MRKLVLGLLALPLACLAAVSAARIDEIAAWLPERPAADGARITDRAAWDRLAATPQGAREVKAAAALLSQPVPDVPDAEYLEFSQTGNRTHYQTSLFRRMGNFVHLYVAECLEARGRFIPRIVDYVDAFAAQRSWTLPAHDAALTCFNGVPHVDLVSANISLSLALCADWLGDRLPAATRAKIRSEVERRTFRPHLDHARGVRRIRDHWWLHAGNNWNSVCNACVVRAALALVEDRRLRAEFVAIAEESVPFALKGYTDDGYCSEGMGYWNYGYGHHLQMGLSVRAATGGRVDLFADPKCKAVMRYAYGFQILNGQSPHFADGGGNADAANLALGRQIWPDLVNTAALKSPAFSGHPAVFSLRAFGQEPAPVAPTLDILPPRSWFPDAQVLLARPQHPERTLTFGVGFKGGHNAELHNHNDIGSYYVMLDGVEMTGDPGGEVYTRRTFSKDRYLSKVLNSYAHPVPVVGGQLQRTGRAAAAKVLRADFTDAKDEVAIEYASAYAVPALKSLVRTLSFDRVRNVLTVSDHLVCSEPTTFEVPVVTYRTWTKNAAATSFSFDKNAEATAFPSDKNAPIRKNETMFKSVPSSKNKATHESAIPLNTLKTPLRKLKMEVTATAPIHFTEERIENPSRPDVQRLAFRFTEPVTEATFTTTFSVH